MADERLLHGIKHGELVAEGVASSRSSSSSSYATQYRILEVTSLGTMFDGTPAYIKRISLPSEDSIGPGNYGKELRRIVEQVSIGRQLDHPNHTQLLDYNSEGDTHRLYYKVGPGKDLRTIVKEQNLDTDDVLTIVEQVAAALSYTHQKNPSIIHGDLSPGNIVYDPETRHVTVVDHGASIAHVIREEILTTRMLVTNGYAAPEVLGGNPTPKSDIYGLGMNLSYLLTGIDQSNFLDWNGQLKRKELEELLRNSTTNSHLVALWKKLVAENPSERPSAEEVLKYVGRIRNGEGLEEKVAAGINAEDSDINEHIERTALDSLVNTNAIVGAGAGLVLGFAFALGLNYILPTFGLDTTTLIGLGFIFGSGGCTGGIIMSGDFKRPRFLYNYFLEKAEGKKPSLWQHFRSIFPYNQKTDEKLEDKVDSREKLLAEEQARRKTLETAVAQVIGNYPVRIAYEQNGTALLVTNFGKEPLSEKEQLRRNAFEHAIAQVVKEPILCANEYGSRSIIMNGKVDPFPYGPRIEGGSLTIFGDCRLPENVPQTKILRPLPKENDEQKGHNYNRQGKTANELEAIIKKITK